MNTHRFVEPYPVFNLDTLRHVPAEDPIMAQEYEAWLAEHPELEEVE